MNKDITSERLVIVGKVLAPHGLAGALRVEVTSDSPGRFSSGGILYLERKPRTIERTSSLSRGMVAVKLEGIDSHADAERVRDSYLMVPAGMVPPLPEGKYYHFQIIDLHVYTREQEYLGQITEILPTGSNDVYVVSHGGKELLIPALDEIITEVDVGNGIMTVDIPEGLR